jgi:hypothetical protein
MERVVCVAAAKVPIVKIWDPELKLAADVNVNNTLALENTRMIKTYVQIDDRVRPLAMIIKYWTKQRILNDAGKSNTCHLLNELTLIHRHRWDAELLRLDLYDPELPPNPKSSNPTCATPASA